MSLDMTLYNPTVYVHISISRHSAYSDDIIYEQPLSSGLTLTKDAIITAQVIKVKQEAEI